MEFLPKYFDPQNKVEKDPELEKLDIHPGEDQFIETKEDHLFHIGQYDENLAKTVFCKHCGGNEFNVGQEDYYTAIRCVNCHWEISIHEG